MNMVAYKIRVPYWGPDDKGILLFGDPLGGGSLIILNPHISPCENRFPPSSWRCTRRGHRGSFAAAPRAVLSGLGFRV